MSELAPGWKPPKMTRSQMKRYLIEMEKKRARAKLELEKAKLSWELNNDDDLAALDEKIDNLY